MRHEVVRLVVRRIRVVCHVIVCAAAIFWRLLVTGVPRFSENQEFYSDEFQPPLTVGNIKQDGWRFGAGVRSGSIDPPVNRLCQPEETRANKMVAHRTKCRMRFAWGRLNIALAPRVGDALEGLQLPRQLLQGLIGLGSRYVSGRARCDQRRKYKCLKEI